MYRYFFQNFLKHINFNFEAPKRITQNELPGALGAILNFLRVSALASILVLHRQKPSSVKGILEAKMLIRRQ
jgi:hypothetical protein